MRFLLLFSFFLMFPSNGLGSDSGLPVSDIAKHMEKEFSHLRPTQWGERVTGVITRLNPEKSSGNGVRKVFLTLDACDGDTDTRIIALLREHHVPATIFVTNSWLRRNAAIVRDLANDPLFAFASHGKRHKPASVNGRKAFGLAGTRSVAALVEEVEDNARAIHKATGKRPAWYRSGTAHYDDVAVKIIHRLGFSIAGYTVSADAGATLSAGKVARLLASAPDGAIILCHCNHPQSGTYGGLARAIPAMKAEGVVFASLEGILLEETYD